MFQECVLQALGIWVPRSPEKGQMDMASEAQLITWHLGLHNILTLECPFAELHKLLSSSGDKYTAWQVCLFTPNVEYYSGIVKYQDCLIVMFMIWPKLKMHKYVYFFYAD